MSVFEAGPIVKEGRKNVMRYAMCANDNIIIEVRGLAAIRYKLEGHLRLD